MNSGKGSFETDVKDEAKEYELDRAVEELT